MDLSFFKRKTISGHIRAGQVAEYMGAKMNPTEGYENDACIYIKQSPRAGKRKYLDMIDNVRYIEVLKQNPEFKAIVIGKLGYDYLRSILKNDVVNIPQQHVNFERVQRARTEIKTVGFCGERCTFAPFEQEIRERLNKIGLELSFFHTYRYRHDVVDFYKNIDIQIVWRLTPPQYIDVLKNPLKLSNASSFGIPTVAQPEDNFVAEYDGCFLPAKSIDELINCVNDLKNKELYDQIAAKAKTKAEEYHISNIAKLYVKLGEE